MSASKRLKIDPALTGHLLIHLFENDVSKTGFKKGVVGLSGGVDPAAACSLAASAFGTANVVVMRLPYRE